ncbi:hypothetical protein CCACVL1_07105 [Corchorus capsularis]|uniref:Uncharacterized protein n=1 Tax=Corchorus capsularis TaxID=210143 RepID=A0A1R3J9E7_COCAP|nr:hypothetical protein CCACVL1_07105 [Corchorus capsularis]
MAVAVGSRTGGDWLMVVMKGGGAGKR